MTGSKQRMRTKVAFACAALLGAAGSARAQTSLATYNVDPATVTIAGISSGGFMAVQMHVAFSSHIHGVAVFAGGPFYCAQDSELDALGGCESGSGLNVQTFVDYTNTQASDGNIDPVSNLASEPVYLFSGTDDTTVHQGTMNALQQYYQAFSVSSLTYNNNTAAAHGWISPDGPNSCDSSYSPYINNCSLDPEQTFLTQFYGTLNAKNTGTLGGTYVQFDQTPFCSGGSCSDISLDSSGWAYVPSACASGAACKLIVVLHGCLQSQGNIGQDLVKESGVNEWADTNNLIVLYPQTTTASSNPDACWDWWGYTNANYSVQSGPQMATLMAMINQVTGQAVISSSTTTSTTASGTSSGTSGTSATAGSTTGGTCTPLGFACTSSSDCCAATSCQYGYCLLSATGTGTAGTSGTTAVTATGTTSGSTSAGTTVGASSTTSGATGGATGGASSTGTSGSASGTTHGAGTASGSTSGAAASTSSGASSTSGSIAALALTAITPASGASTSPTSVTLEGSGFQPLVQALVGSTRLTTVTLDSPAVLSAVVPSGLVAGVYDVTVINPDGTQAVLRQAFTVTSAGTTAGAAAGTTSSGATSGAESNGGCSSGSGSFSALGLLAVGLAALQRRRHRAVPRRP